MSKTKKNSIERFQPDKFPGLLENPAGYRKATDDYTVTFAVPIGAVERLQPLMQKAGKPFIVYLVQVATPEQAEALLDSDDHPSPPASPAEGKEGEASADVETLAALLGMTERNVQLQVDNNLLVRSTRGRYDMLLSYAALWRAHQSLRSGQNDEYNEQRTASMRLKRQERELNYLERAGKLVNAEKMQSAYENVESEERHAIINMPKTLGPQCDGLPGTEVEIRLNDWSRRHLAKFSSFDQVLAMARGREKEAGPAAEKQVVSQRRKGRKGKRRKE